MHKSLCAKSSAVLCGSPAAPVVCGTQEANQPIYRSPAARVRDLRLSCPGIQKPALSHTQTHTNTPSWTYTITGANVYSQMAERGHDAYTQIHVFVHAYARHRKASQTRTHPDSSVQAGMASCGRTGHHAHRDPTLGLMIYCRAFEMLNNV